MPRPTIIVKDRDNLVRLIRMEIKKYGPTCDLNHLDVSGVTYMHSVFAETQFNGNVSEWDVSNVQSMNQMFQGCAFNGDISKWNTSKVNAMSFMFAGSTFNGDISNWNVGLVVRMNSMFSASQFNGDLSAWNVSSLDEMDYMFSNSPFKGDLSKWNPRIVLKHGTMSGFLEGIAYSGDLSHWIIDDVNNSAAAFSPTFRGTLPVSEQPINTEFYEALFNGGHLLDRYLRTAPFGGAHFDMLRLTEDKPNWAMSEDYQWAQEIAHVGLGIGMNDNELRKYAVQQYALRKVSSPTVADDSYKVDDLVAQ